VPQKLVLRLHHGAPPPPAHLRVLLGRSIHRDTLVDGDGDGAVRDVLTLAGWTARASGELLQLDDGPAEIYLLEHPGAEPLGTS